MGCFHADRGIGGRWRPVANWFNYCFKRTKYWYFEHLCIKHQSNYDGRCERYWKCFCWRPLQRPKTELKSGLVTLVVGRRENLSHRLESLHHTFHVFCCPIFVLVSVSFTVPANGIILVFVSFAILQMHCTGIHFDYHSSKATMIGIH